MRAQDLPLGHAVVRGGRLNSDIGAAPIGLAGLGRQLLHALVSVWLASGPTIW